MKRKDFLRNIGFASVIPLLPLSLTAARSKPETILFKDIFKRRRKNMSLLNFKNSDLYVELVRRIKAEKLPVYDSTPVVYCGVYSISLQYKEVYDAIEIRHFFEDILDACLKRGQLFNCSYDGIMRFYHDKKTGTIVPDIFTNNSWNKPHLGNLHSFYTKDERIIIKGEMGS